MMESTTATLLKLWNDQDIQVMILISLTVQLFLLFTGNLRRRRTSEFLRFIIWLAYVGADAIAVFTVGLFSQYEEKYKLRSHQSSSSSSSSSSSGTGNQTLPFLWAPFLLLHLGGQDTITAFSMEDNNLWLRHLLNLAVQVTLTLYIFWKLFDILVSELLAVAVPVFVAGTIKYGERTWALYSGSRDYLSSRNNEGGQQEKPLRDYRSSNSCGDVVACYALNTVLRVRGLLVGRTLFQLGQQVETELVDDFSKQVQRSEGIRLRIVLVELRMMYDLLYTKAMVLQSRTGRILRCIAEISMVVAFVLFMTNRELHTQQNRANVAITYTLFVGAMFMEAYSVSMVILSPWTRARSKRGSFLNWLSSSCSCSAYSLSNAGRMQRGETSNQRQQRIPGFSIGQFNLTDYSVWEKHMPRLVSKVVGMLGLENKWRNFWHVQYVEDKEMSLYIERLLCSGEGSHNLELGRELNYVLSLPFEHALFRLHIFTDMHLSRLGNQGGEMELLVSQCRKLSQYIIYLMVVHPSMLPVSNAAQDLQHYYNVWVRDHRGTMEKPGVLDSYAEVTLCNETYSRSPFGLSPPTEASLRAMRELWARLLIYVAGKCPVELHARQLGNGLELLTSVWLLMVHRGLGDVGKREVNLFESADPYVPKAGSLVSVNESCWRQRQEEPLYAFQFREHELQPTDETPRLFVTASGLHKKFDILEFSITTMLQQLEGTSRETDVPVRIDQVAGVMDYVAIDVGASDEEQDIVVALEIEHRGDPGN
uniref:Uncharacterized protein n=1 Tax=Avena sativa TaxID=4498 RepID=A0ACD5VCQ4_AVESA